MLTPETIANKTFRRTLLGYDLEQVDDFLDEIILHLQQQEAEREELNAIIVHLTAELRRMSKLLDKKEEVEEEVAFPMSPHADLGVKKDAEKASRVKTKKAKAPKIQEGEGVKKPRKPKPSVKPEPPEAIEMVETPETPSPRQTEPQEETKRFRIPTAAEPETVGKENILPPKEEMEPVSEEPVTISEESVAAGEDSTLPPQEERKAVSEEPVTVGEDSTLPPQEERKAVSEEPVTISEESETVGEEAGHE